MLGRLRPEHTEDFSQYKEYTGYVKFSDFEFELNEFGGIGSLTCKGAEIIHKNNNPLLLEYRLYTSKDYDFWFSHYSRNMDKNGIWAYPDFGRPLLKYADGKYPAGRFYYKMTGARIAEEENQIRISADLRCDKALCEQAGAPREVQVIYTLDKDGLKFDVLWCGKDANRLTEAIFLHLYPAAESLSLIKLGREIDYKSTVSMGGRNLHAVEKCIFANKCGNFEICNYHSPIISVGRGKILEYDNKIESFENDGVAFVLQNNVWGTNFPLWYEDNARFAFCIKEREFNEL